LSRDKPDTRLVQRAIAHAEAGDAAGPHFLYARYAGDVLSCVDGLVHDRGEAEEVTRDVFAGLMTAIKEREQRDAPFAAWILRTARAAARERLRVRRGPTASGV
jgi:RNA polymerase sigma-70 factor (ECF subfamily)